jgi:hypothetical protein
MSEKVLVRKPPTRHPSTQIPEAVVQEISYRAYLSRLEPPMTPEEAEVWIGLDGHDRVVGVEYLRRNARVMEPLTRVYLRHLVDMGIVTP